MINYYYSGAGVSLKKEDASILFKLIQSCPYRLLSCEPAYVSFAKKWIDTCIYLNYRPTILLDSGAFTAWNKGEEVTLDNLLKIYADMIGLYQSKVSDIFLINLDKIPGSPGRTAGPEEIEECIRISDLNFNILVKEFGPRILPVFHQNENESRLKDVASMAEYICVSPRNDLPEGQRVAWSKEVHNKVKNKTHGLAATGIRMMTEVSWYSVDSATWIFLCSTGRIVSNINGKLKMIGISEKSSDRFQANQHYLTVTKEVKKILDDKFDLYQIDPNSIMTNLNYRLYFTIKEINSWLENDHEFSNTNFNGLFDL